MTESRIRELLSEAMTDAGRAVDLDLVANRVRARRRAKRAVAGACVLGLAVVGVVIATAPSSTPRSDRLVTDPTPTQAPTQQVTVGGLTFPVPAGWTEAKPLCWPTDRTVVVGYWMRSCPASPGGEPGVTAVRLAPDYGPQSYGGAQGTRFVWKGQPAWLAQDQTAGETTVRLTLPWLNATISAQSPDPAEARQLVETAEPHPQTDLAVPSSAASVHLESFTGHDGDGQDRSRTITNPADVRRLLTDLRSLTVTDSPGEACDETIFEQQSVTITVHAAPDVERTYRARFPCGQVDGGTGVAGLIKNSTLLNDVRRLVPNSGLATG